MTYQFEPDNFFFTPSFRTTQIGWPTIETFRSNLYASTKNPSSAIQEKNAMFIEDHFIGEDDVLEVNTDRITNRFTFSVHNDNYFDVLNRIDENLREQEYPFGFQTKRPQDRTVP